MIIENQQDVTTAVLSELQRAPDAAVQGDHVRLRSPPARIRARGEADRGGIPRRHRLRHRARQAQQRDPQRGGADVGLARPVGADLPAQQRRSRHRRKPTRTCSGRSGAMHSPVDAERRLDRALADAGAGDVRRRLVPRHQRQADRRRRGRHLALLAGRLLREPGSGSGRHEPARQVHHRRGGPYQLPQREARRLSDPDRRPDRRSPARAGPAQHAAGASAFPRQQGRLQDAGLAALRPGRQVHRHRRAVRRHPPPHRRLHPPRERATRRRPTSRAPWYSLDHNFVMEAGRTKLPRPPITGKASGERPKIPHLA